MKQRIFIGIFLTDDIKKKIGEWRSNRQELPVRWMPEENLHVTLVPPWYEEDVEGIVERMKLLQKGSLVRGDYQLRSFDISFEKISFGPDTKRPRMIWARGEMPEEFKRLRNALSRVLGKEVEIRRPILHSTLARFNQEQYSQFQNKNIETGVDWAEAITGFSLIGSSLQATGSMYKEIEHFDL